MEKQLHCNLSLPSLHCSGPATTSSPGRFSLALEVGPGKRYVSFLYCVRYNEDFVKSRFCSIHFAVVLGGLKKIVRYTEDFVI